MNPKVKALLQLPQPAQRSPEWYATRKTRITASAASALLVKDEKTCKGYVDEYNLHDFFDINGKCANPYSSKTQFILDKCVGSSFSGSVATQWGQRFEPVVTDFYAKKYGTKVLEFGLIAHPNLNFIAASPDGITPDGVMIEIKCPYRRKITGIPPFYYYIQCQLQLEVCDLDVCHFVEAGFIEYGSLYEFLDNNTLDVCIIEKGILLEIETEGKSTQYIYPPVKALGNIKELLEWRCTATDKFIKDNELILEEDNNIYSIYRNQNHKKFKIKVCYWKMNVFSNTTIKRDKDWFKNILPTLKKEWEVVLHYKHGNNYQELIKKNEKEIKESEEKTCILDESDSD